MESLIAVSWWRTLINQHRAAQAQSGTFGPSLRPRIAGLKPAFTRLPYRASQTGKERMMRPDATRCLLLIDDEPAQRRLVTAIGARAGWWGRGASDIQAARGLLLDP